MSACPKCVRLVIALGALAVPACAPSTAAHNATPALVIPHDHAAAPAATPPPPAPPSGTTVETWDPGLRAALAQLNAHRTPATYRAVAAEYARLKIRDMAYANYTHALHIDPADAASYDGRARLWRDFGFPKNGLADAFRARYFAPKSPEAANTIGTLFEAMGRFDDAITWYAKAAVLDPSASFALTNMCHVHLSRGFASALIACQRALEADSASRVASNNLALAYAAAGDFAHARAQFASAGDRAQTAYNMGIVFMAARRFDDAAQEFRAARLAQPSMVAASERLRQSESLKKTN